MPLEAISSTNNISFKGSETKLEEKQEKTPELIKNGKKKLALALAGAAVVGASVVGIAKHRTNVFAKGLEDKSIQELIDMVKSRTGINFSKKQFEILNNTLHNKILSSINPSNEETIVNKIAPEFFGGISEQLLKQGQNIQDILEPYINRAKNSGIDISDIVTNTNEANIKEVVTQIMTKLQK